MVTRRHGGRTSKEEDYEEMPVRITTVTGWRMRILLQRKMIYDPVTAASPGILALFSDVKEFVRMVGDTA